MDWIAQLCRCFNEDAVYYTQHAKTEMETEQFGQIMDLEVHEAVCAGKVIEQYLQDRPYQSVLVLGLTKRERPLHIVCAYNEKESQAIVITVYQPDPQRWIAYKTRRTI